MYEGRDFETRAVVTQRANGTISVNAQTIPNYGCGLEDSYIESIITHRDKANWQWKRPDKEQFFPAMAPDFSLSTLRKIVVQSKKPDKEFDYDKAVAGIRKLQRAIRRVVRPIDAQLRSAVKKRDPKAALFTLQNGARISPHDPGLSYDHPLISRLMIESYNPDTQRWLDNEMIEKILVREQAQDSAKNRMNPFFNEGIETAARHKELMEKANIERAAKHKELTEKALIEGKEAPKLSDVTYPMPELHKVAYQMAYGSILPFIQEDIAEFRNNLEEAIPKIIKAQHAIREHQKVTPPLSSVQDYRFRRAVILKKTQEALEALKEGAKISSTDLGGENIFTRLTQHVHDQDARRWLGNKMLGKIKIIFRLNDAIEKGQRLLKILETSKHV